MRYKDEVEKLNFYKKKIMQELTQKGIYPDDISVKKRLDAIDAKLAVFQFIDYEEGSTFDTKSSMLMTPVVPRSCRSISTVPAV